MNHNPLGGAPCHKSRNRAFISPSSASDEAIAAAKAVCKTCPILQECAAQALNSGDTLNPGYSGPAMDVIQAGVICRGDLTTALELSLISGVPVPDYLAAEERRAKVQPQCQSCERPMVSWTRGKVPDGHVMHYARGFCTNCRQAYKRAAAEAPRERQGLRKIIDRKRHHHISMEKTVCNRENQPALFDLGYPSQRS